MRELVPQPNEPLRPANKCSYQNIFLFFNKKITCKALKQSIVTGEKLMSSSRRKKYFPFLILLLLFLLVSGCGYRMRGTQELRGDLQTVAILPFVNKTFESRLENDLFNALVDEFARSKNLKVVAAKDADLLVNGTIATVANNSISYSPDDKTYEYRVIMTVDVEVTEARSQQIFWRRSAMREVEEYKSTGEPFIIDRRKQAALKRVCQVLAENIHDGLFTNF